MFDFIGTVSRVAARIGNGTKEPVGGRNDATEAIE
jgi:hypothetical protein